MFPNWPGESRTSVRNTNFSQTHPTLLQNTQISVMGPWVFAGSTINACLSRFHRTDCLQASPSHLTVGGSKNRSMGNFQKYSNKLKSTEKYSIVPKIKIKVVGGMVGGWREME